MSDRRKFVKGFGLLSAVLGGMAAAPHLYANNVPATSVTPKVDPDLAPAPWNGSTLRITGNNTPPKAPVASHTFLFTPTFNPAEANAVDISVGKDNRLWIKVGDQWRRVALES